MTRSSLTPGVPPARDDALRLRPRADRDQLFADGGEAGALMRSIDWSATPIGPIEGWPQALRTMVGLLLRNRTPMLVWWGPQFVQLYNDAYRPVLGDKHPRSMAQPTRECWSEIWHIIGPMIEAPFRGEPATTSDDLFLLMNRKGFVEETHFIVAYSPVPDETVPGTGIGGVVATVTETTEQVYAERQLRTLRELGARAAEANTAEQACANAAHTLAGNDRDVPFALFYLLDDSGKTARLVSHVGFGEGSHAAAPTEIDLTAEQGGAVWPIARVIARHEPEVLDDLGALPALPTGAWTQPPERAIACPLASPDLPVPYGVLICGVSPHRALDAGYRTFFELAVAQVVTAIRNATAYQTERRRAELLAEIDHAKTAFFSNVSHEFRTPLTLMLGPAEDALADQRHPLAPAQRERIELVHRNGVRLQKLVNTLLDFARSEAGRARGAFVATDLAALTTDLASGFRSVVENAGLQFVVECDALPEPVHVDPSMWEKIVLNLLSNAFKFTFSGRIRVALRAASGRAELTVEDTGSGIPAHELPRIFERFHRVEGAHGRSHEGSGIGLALVRDLVTLHGGSVEVESTLGAGSSFRVSIPFGVGHVPKDRASTAPALASTAVHADAFVAEAERWIDVPPPSATQAVAASTHARILVADDNADMRDYVRRLLETRWTVETAADGAAALRAARRDPPDLILSDVMMPGLSGFELLAELRRDERTRSIPVVLLSARAGEESRIEGLESGADDYLVKPFSARELLARVNTHLKIARLRADAESASRAKDEFLAILGHELRNPLAPILTALQLMKLTGGDAMLRERRIIERQVSHVVRLVDDLLDVSRITRGKIDLNLEHLELADVVAKAIEMASPLIEQKRHRLEVSVAPDGLCIYADPIRLAQVVSNLLTNAAKYTEAGGQITVTAERADRDVVLLVRDTGVGIEPEMIDRVFDSFVQADQMLDRSLGGLGLGLTIVRSLVTAHGGTIRAASAGKGHGSEFMMTLPFAKDAMLDGMPAGGARDAIARPDARRVLVVDDNQDAADLLAEGLRANGHSPVVAYDGPAALAVAAVFKPQLAFLDIGLPAMDGYELAQRLKQLPGLSGVRLVAVTGYGQASDRMRSKVAGFDEHLIKPIDVERAAELIVSLTPKA